MSTETINKRAARIGATLTAALLITYAITGMLAILVIIVFDYVIRVATSIRPPIASVANAIVIALHVPAKPMNKGPKIFAWRLGFIMAVAALATLPFSHSASIAIAIGLAGFNLLDGVGNYCVGCAIYTYLVLPSLGPDRAAL